MNETQFEVDARRQGFDDVRLVELPPAEINAVHNHAFDFQGFVLDGQITISMDGTATPYTEGGVFVVPAGHLHQETVARGGVRFVSAIRRLG